MRNWKYDDPTLEKKSAEKLAPPPGQVEVKDAAGNPIFRDASIGTGPDYLKSKHPNGRFTGKKDAHGNEIWETPEA